MRPADRRVAISLLAPLAAAPRRLRPDDRQIPLARLRHRADLLVLILLAAAVLVAAQGLGTLLAVAALVGPAATARLLTHRSTR